MNLNELKLRVSKLRNLVAIPKSERYSKSIENVKKGSFIKIYGELFLIEDVYEYKVDDKWTELKLLNILTGEIKYMEIEIDDEIELYLTTKEIKKRNLPVSIDEVEEMSEVEDGIIKIDGVNYYYEDDYKAKFKRANSDKKETVYLYEFKSDNDNYLTIEEWKEKDDYSYQIFLSSPLDVAAIEIVSI